MSLVNISPNMLLPVPVPTQDPGPDWANNLYSCLYSQIDAHDHSSNKGVQITPAGLNINSTNGPLSFGGTSATNLLTTSYIPQTSPLSGGTYPAAVYVSGVDLYYNDVSGNQIKITSGGSVNATSSGITSGTATASFVSSILVVNASTNTPANIQGGSIFLGNNVINSKYLELSPPNTMADNYQLILPSLPSGPSFVQLDKFGNITASIPIANGIGTSNLALGSVTTAILANNAVTSAIRNSANFQSGTISGTTNITNSVSLVAVSGLSVTIASNSTNKKYALCIQSTGTTVDSNITLTNTVGGTVNLAARVVLQGSVSGNVSDMQLSGLCPPTGNGGPSWPGIFFGYYTPSAGGESFDVYAKVNNSTAQIAFSSGLQLVAIEQV